LAAEVCLSEATELPALKRPAVSVANRFCHPWTLDPGSSELARDDKFYSLVWFVSGLDGCFIKKSAPYAQNKTLDIIKGLK
jgi:hypothetical protein